MVAYGFHGPYSPVIGPEENTGVRYTPDYRSTPRMGSGPRGMGGCW
jgi:hypothetical protein